MGVLLFWKFPPLFQFFLAMSEADPQGSYVMLENVTGKHLIFARPLFSPLDFPSLDEFSKVPPLISFLGLVYSPVSTLAGGG